MHEKELSEIASRLEQLGKVLEKLPAEVRGQAFELLKGYVTEHSSPSGIKRASVKTSDDAAADTREEFFGRFDHDKPDRNVRLITAYLYGEYGIDPFAVDEVRQIANDVGITIPARVDMTLRTAKEGGKMLFTRVGRGKFKPTVHGETHLKVTYSVNKGTKKRPQDAE